MGTALKNAMDSLRETRTRCPACGGSQARELDVRSAHRTQWMVCDLCRSYFSAEKFDIAAEVTHTQAMSWGNESQGLALNEAKDRMFRFIVALLLRDKPPPAALLDVGCSFGGFLDRASRAGYQVTGTDIVPDAVDYVTKKLNIPAYACSSVDQMPSTDPDKFDIVTCLDCNYYWSDQRQELALIKERMTTGGLLCVRTVDKSWLVTTGLLVRKVLPGAGAFLIRKAVNDHRFSMPVKSLLALLKELGFDIVYASPNGALHSDQSGFAVKMAFAFGNVLHRLTGRFLAPGAVIVARARV
jgi:2-polyprenyl-3-methyl-5-hydroxy-6-metoxy-1,4-benzoquinol methylase